MTDNTLNRRVALQRLALPALLLVAGLFLRLNGLDRPILDHEMAQQGRTAMIARNYVERSPWIFSPEIDGFGPERTLWLKEFPLYPWTVSLVYRVTGVDVLWGRLLSILFSLAASICLYRIGTATQGRQAGAIAMAFLLFSPVSIIQGRSFENSSMVLFLMLLSIDLLLVSLSRDRTFRRKPVVFAGVTMALATLCDPAAALLLAPAGYLHWKHWRVEAGGGERSLLRWALNWRRLLFGVLVVFPAIRWSVWAMSHASAGQAETMALSSYSDFLRISHYFAWIRADFFRTVAQHSLSTVTTWPWLLLAAAGAFLAKRKDRSADIWFLAGLICLMLNANVVVHQAPDKYYLYLTPPMALFAAMGFGYLWSLECKWRVFFRALVVALVIAGSALSWTEAKPLFGVIDPVHPDRPATLPGYNHWPAAAADIRNTEIVPSDALVIVDSEEPSLLYYCHRRGWGVSPSLLTPAKIEQLRNEGAEYLLLSDTSLPAKDPELAAYLKEHCTIYVMRDTNNVFVLKEPGR